jgi:hypothetical protein
MKKTKAKHGGKRQAAGRKPAYPGEGPAIRLSFSAPQSVVKRLGVAAEQLDVSQSAIVLAGLRAILSQSTDRLQDAVAARSKRPAADRLPGGAAD